MVSGQLDQRQASRHPTHAAIEAASQLLQRVPKALLDFPTTTSLVPSALSRGLKRCHLDSTRPSASSFSQTVAATVSWPSCSSAATCLRPRLPGTVRGCLGQTTTTMGAAGVARGLADVPIAGPVGETPAVSSPARVQYSLSRDWSFAALGKCTGKSRRIGRNGRN